MSKASEALKLYEFVENSGLGTSTVGDSLAEALKELNKPPEFRIEDTIYSIWPSSCRCGGSWAWVRQISPGAWMMVGCICHHLPTFMDSNV